MLPFFKWMNKQHPSITFTKEEEQDNKLAFLDVLLTRTTDGSIVTSIYRKPTFSGLYMKWDRFVPKSYKKGLVNCLVFRAWKLCSSYVAQKLSCRTRLKSKLNVLSWSGVVYQISCSQCEAFYVGKTKRRLEQRVQEHSQQGYSSLYKHSSDLCHQIDYSNPAVISVDNNDYRLQIKEALKIKDLKAYNSLNANIRSCELKLC